MSVRIVIVRGDSAASEAPDELESVKRYTRVMTEFFDRAGLSHTVLSDHDVTSERLKGIKLVVLPHNPNVPANVAGEIVKFLEAGGKLLACYTLPKRLEPVTGIRVGAHIPQKYKGNFASIRPSDDALNGMPVVTGQASWNIRDSVNYNMGWATDKEFVTRMKADGRTQVRHDGSSNERWLCPPHPDNQKLEIESMLEVARKYDVHGLHFDYIRYPGNEGCFCNGCRLRFEKVAGKKVRNWPADVRNDDKLYEKWLDFRRKQITDLVAAVAQQAKKLRPDIKISAAVFRNWPVDRNAVGQDWKLWCDRGYLDFVCPMDYTDSSVHFERMVEQQLAWAGEVPCFPGIGLSVWSNPADICKLIEQINVTRKLGTGGFTIFNYSPTEANKILPRLGHGLTRSP